MSNYPHDRLSRNIDEVELDSLYETVLKGYSYGSAYPAGPSAVNGHPNTTLNRSGSPLDQYASSSSRIGPSYTNGTPHIIPATPPKPPSHTSSGRGVRPLPPTPGGSTSRPVAPVVHLIATISSIGGSPRQPPGDIQSNYFPEARDGILNDYTYPLPIERQDPLLSENETPINGPTSADTNAAHRWSASEVPMSPTEYCEPDTMPVPEYRRDLRDDPNAVSVVIEGEEYNHVYRPDNEPPYDPDLSYMSTDGPPYEANEAGPSYVQSSVPHELDDNPPYELNDPAYAENIELNRGGDNHSLSETSTFISADFPMLHRPTTQSSVESYSPVHLAYLSEVEIPTEEIRTTADASSWNGITNVNVPVSSYDHEPEPVDWNYPGPSNLGRRVTNDLMALRSFEHRSHLDAQIEDEEEDDYNDDSTQFIDLSFLSNLAVQLQTKVPRGTHVKGSIPYPRAFTGRDIVTTLHSSLEPKLIEDHGCSKNDRRAALQVARSLQKQLFFYEVEWGARILQDGVEDVYMFLDDPEDTSEGIPERAELPSGVVTMLTKCYSVSCGEGVAPCYSYGCPLKGLKQLPTGVEVAQNLVREDWTKAVPPHILRDLPDYEIQRQTIIHKLVSKEEQYVEDLDIVENVFIRPLRVANVMAPYALDEFIEEVFGNILELRDCNRRLLEVMYVRQREEAPIIKTIGDIFLDIATEFRNVYPTYVGRHYLAEKRLKEELELNPEFRLYIEKCERKLSTRAGEPRLDLKHYLNRPGEHLQKYPVLLEAVYNTTSSDDADGDFLQEAITAIKNLQNVAQLRTFQSAMGKGPTGKWQWHDLLAPSMRKKFTKEESQRQSLIFELIQGEMAYVRDLENIETLYLRPLKNSDPPIIPPDRLDQFLLDVFHNFQELHAHHRRLVDKLHDIQLEEHPNIKSITAAVFDAALNFREAYMEYIPNYPIAAYRIDDEMANNHAFKAFVDNAIRHPDAYKLDMKAFINRPIPRLLRYELLLKEILGQTPSWHDDRTSIPHVIEVISALARETEPGVSSAKQKVELWKYNSNLVFKLGETVDMDLLHENRSLIYTGKLLRQPDSTIQELNAGWSELFVLLFDNYLVMTKPREKDGITKYTVHRRPIPLDLLSLVNFTDPPTQRSAGLLRNLRNTDNASINSNARSPDSSDPRSVYPCTIHHNGRLGGPYILYAESAQVRVDWRQKLDEALGLRKVVQESNKVFEIETLSIETFIVPPLNLGTTSPAWHDGTLFTGKVTCSVPFNTPDGRGLVAIGCAEGVWIGFRHDSRSMRRVLHVKMVTQCAMLEDFGLFLVLADKSLFAYHIEALVPNPLNPQPYTSQTPQKINGSRDVHFFSVGTLHGRTLVIYMNKKGMDSVFHVVEPVIDKINERPKAPGGILPILSRRTKSEWFRNYRDFFLPCESFDLIFLKAKIAVLCTKGFEIMDMTDFKSVTIPQKDNPTMGAIARRCESCRPLGMFRSSEDEFLLCYDEFGIYVNKHGIPSRQIGTIEWEGTAERVALHAPYILLFDPRFIEIRHIDTGRLSQIIPGHEVRCIWDGRGPDVSPATQPVDRSDEDMVQEPRVHAVMQAPEPLMQHGGRQMRGIAQHVFELVPTIPLYLPGSLASPSTITYFPQSFSPPRSPPLRASGSRS